MQTTAALLSLERGLQGRAGERSAPYKPSDETRTLSCLPRMPSEGALGTAQTTRAWEASGLGKAGGAGSVSRTVMWSGWKTDEEDPIAALQLRSSSTVASGAVTVPPRELWRRSRIGGPRIAACGVQGTISPQVACLLFPLGGFFNHLFLWQESPPPHPLVSSPPLSTGKNQTTHPSSRGPSLPSKMDKRAHSLSCVLAAPPSCPGLLPQPCAAKTKASALPPPLHPQPPPSGQNWHTQLSALGLNAGFRGAPRGLSHDAEAVGKAHPEKERLAGTRQASRHLRISES